MVRRLYVGRTEDVVPLFHLNSRWVGHRLCRGTIWVAPDCIRSHLSYHARDFSGSFTAPRSTIDKRFRFVILSRNEYA